MFTACFNRLWLLMSFVRLFAVYSFTFMPVRSVFFCPVQTCGPLIRPPHFFLFTSHTPVCLLAAVTVKKNCSLLTRLLQSI